MCYYIKYKTKLQEGVTTKVTQKWPNGTMGKSKKKSTNIYMTNYREEERIAKLHANLEKQHLKHIDLPFVNAKTPIRVQCLDCGEVFENIPDLLKLNKFPCPGCRIEKKRKVNLDKVKDKIDTRMHELGADKDFTVVAYPELMKGNLTLKHLACGNLINTSIGNLSRPYRGVRGTGSGCEYCSGTHTYTEDEILTYMETERHGYEFHGSFMEGNHLMVKVTHLVCGVKRDLQFNYFMRGEGCKYCGISGGEETILATLSKQGITYEREKNFGFESYQRARYDFFLPERNLIIEYDGKQHFKPLEIWGGEELFAERTYRDRKKNKLALDAGMDVIRIPYTIKGVELQELISDIVSNDSEKYSQYFVTGK